jgi:hypothetical protein
VFSAKGFEPSASYLGQRAKDQARPLGTWPGVLSTTLFELSASCEGLRASGHGQRAKGEGQRALPLGRRAERFAPSVLSEPLRAQSQVPSAQGEVRRARKQWVPSGRSRIRNPLRDADRKPGAGLRSSPAVRACRNYTGGFFQFVRFSRFYRFIPALRGKEIFF